jgi:hypothetical protein
VAGRAGVEERRKIAGCRGFQVTNTVRAVILCMLEGHGGDDAPQQDHESLLVNPKQ